MKRQQFITSMATLASGALAFPVYGKYQSDNIRERKMQTSKPPVIEWNAHLFSADTQKYPFHEKATYVPDASRLSSTPLADYLEHLDQQGIDKAVVVHPEPYGDDHWLIIDAVAQSNGRIKGTTLYYPSDSTAPRKLAALAKSHPDIVATRFHAHRGKENYLKSFSDPGVRALWAAAVEHGMIVELHIGPNYAKSATEAIKDFPGCKVLIDHLAEPHMGDAVEYADILKMADLPNVYMKFSGLAHFADDAPDFLSGRAFTNQVISAFGVDRMVMGGVSPKTVDLHMEGYSEKDKAKVKGGNLAELLDWD